MKRLALLCGAMLFFAGVASAQDSPKVEAFGGYSYVRANPGDGVPSENFNGGSGSLSYNIVPWLGIVGDVGGYHWNGSGDFSGTDYTVFSYLFGPKIALRHGPFTPFVQALFGGARISGTSCSSDVRVHAEQEGSSSGCGSGSQNDFAMTMGGGVDWNATPHIGVRLIQAEYFLTDFSVFSAGHQNNARVSAGVVIRF